MRMGHLAIASVMSLVMFGCTSGGAPVATASRPTAGASHTIRLRVLTYNIHHGEGADGRIDLTRVATIVNSVEPDLVAVQEVDVRTRRSGGVDQAAELARLTGLHPFFVRIIDYQGGPYGLLVLSRDQPYFETSHELPYQPGEEPRRVAEVRIRVGGTGAGREGAAGAGGPRGEGVEVAFFSTHLDYRAETVRLRQVERIEQLTRAVDAPVAILSGDFNAEPGSAPIRRLLETWRDTADDDGKEDQLTSPANLLTYPSVAPTKRIDYVFYRPSRLRVVGRRVIDEPVASDHRPVLAEFEVVSCQPPSATPRRP